jgi:hypothetical protein
MACTIIEGREIDCRDSVGGVAEVYIAEFTNISQSAIIATSGSITTFTMNPTKKFYTFQMEKGNAQADEKINSSQENGSNFTEQTVTFNMKKLTAAKRNDIVVLSQARLMVIVKDNNGLFRVYGQTGGMDLGETTGTTGKAFGDLNGWTLTLTGMEPSPANFISQALVTTATA